jgi:hypothetical protein
MTFNVLLVFVAICWLYESSSGGAQLVIGPSNKNLIGPMTLDVT